jgi:peptidoglycan-associated lipoprotein
VTQQPGTNCGLYTGPTNEEIRVAQCCPYNTGILGVDWFAQKVCPTTNNTTTSCGTLPSGACKGCPTYPIGSLTCCAAVLGTRARTQPQLFVSVSSTRTPVRKPVFFRLDSAELDESGRSVASANAQVLKKFTTWGITIEGHCDERGTAEYNLALGERRAVAVKTYLSSLGVSPERIRVVSYGKEFPFDMGHSEDAWSQNRRGHFVITSK